MARKNAKTALAAALALAALAAEGEMQAEIDLVANNTKQARLDYEQCKTYVRSIDPKGKWFKIRRDTIEFMPTNSKLQVLCSESMGLDGYNGSFICLDEFHAQTSWDLFSVLRSSQGMRRDPLMCVITTAGFILEGGPCYEMWENCKEILSGAKSDDT